MQIYKIKNKTMKKYSPKIVIVGSWAAGLRAAIHFYENDMKDILVVGDRKFTDAHTTQARGWINAALATLDKEDTTIIHAVDTFREWGFLANPVLVETLTENAPDAIADLVSWGADFHKEDDDTTLTQRFFGAHSYRRTCFSGDQTGKEMIRSMCHRARELEIPFLEDTYVYELLKEGDKVSWVLAINKENEHIHIDAPIVIFACGGFTNTYFRSSSRNKENFWDAIDLAYRAGAMVGDIEMVQFHPTGLLYPEEKFGELVTEAVRGEGGKLFNAQGERFMPKYDPKKMELSTRDVVARANFAEIHEWRGTDRGWVWLDISHKPREYILERLPKMHSMILKYNNVDIADAPVEIAPTTHYTMGGIWFDEQSYETTIKNFFVAWECTMGVHGANRLGGNSLMETMVFGKKIAEKILAEHESIEKKSHEVDIKNAVCTGVLDPDQVLTNIRKQVWEYAGIVRNEQELKMLTEILEKQRVEIEEKWIKCSGDEYTNIMMKRRIESVLDFAQMICDGALARTESRGAHFRSDYPEIKEEFAKNYLQVLKDGVRQTFWKDVPKPSEKLQYGLDTFEDTQNYGHSE